MWVFHGALDDIVPITNVEDQVARIRACAGADPDGLELTVYPDEEHVSAIDRTYDGSGGVDIYTWLLEHTSESSQ
jgi:hypothetical protein